MTKLIVTIATTALLFPLASVAVAQNSQYDTTQQPSIQYYNPPSVQQQAQQLAAERQAEAERQAYAERQAEAYGGDTQAERMREAEARSKWDWDHKGQLNRAEYGARRTPGQIAAAPVPCRQPGIAARLRAKYNPQDNDYGRLISDFENGIFAVTVYNEEYYLLFILLAAAAIFAYMWVHQIGLKDELCDGASEVCTFYVLQNKYLERRANESTQRYNKLHERVEELEQELAEATRMEALASQAPERLGSGDVRGDRASTPQALDSETGNVAAPSVAIQKTADVPLDLAAENRALRKRIENQSQQIRKHKEQLRKYGEDNDEA